jgi:hypothetical protein
MLVAPAVEDRLDLPQCLFALARGQTLERAHIVRAAAENAHALGPTQLDASK